MPAKFQQDCINIGAKNNEQAKMIKFEIRLYDHFSKIVFFILSFRAHGFQEGSFFSRTCLKGSPEKEEAFPPGKLTQKSSPGAAN